MQVKAFLQLFGVAAYVSLIFIVILVMRGYGLGANSLSYFGTILFLFLSLLLMIFVFSKGFYQPVYEFNGYINQSDNLWSCRIPALQPTYAESVENQR